MKRKVLTILAPSFRAKIRGVFVSVSLYSPSRIKLITSTQKARPTSSFNNFHRSSTRFRTNSQHILLKKVYQHIYLKNDYQHILLIKVYRSI